MLSIKPYGAFVEYEGCDVHGLVHISQLARGHVESVDQVVSVGDTVKVKVLQSEEGRLSLSMKSVDQGTGADLGGDAPVRRGRGENDEAELATLQWGKADQQYQLAPLKNPEAAAPEKPKVKPNFEASGKLAEESNKVNGVTLKWAEPPDAQKPTKRWRLYVFKGKEALEPYQCARAAYLAKARRH